MKHFTCLSGANYAHSQMKWDKIQEEVGETVFLKQLKKCIPSRNTHIERCKLQSMCFLWAWKGTRYLHGDPVYTPAHTELKKKTQPKYPSYLRTNKE